jgi:hypothetical protein
MGLIRKHARSSGGVLDVDSAHSKDSLILTSRVTYHGFELQRDEEDVDEFPTGREQEARQALAMALAKGEARHPAVRRNRRAIEELRELYRRSGGATPRLTLADLAARYEQLLGDVNTIDQFRAAPLHLDLWPLVNKADRERLSELPSTVEIRGKWVDVEYDLEESDGQMTPVARLRLPEKLARSLVDEEVPVLDRALRFVVHRGPRGTVRASSLDELQALLDRPWSPDEPMDFRPRRKRDARPGRRQDHRRHGRGRDDRRRRRRR